MSSIDFIVYIVYNDPNGLIIRDLKCTRWIVYIVYNCVPESGPGVPAFSQECEEEHPADVLIR